MKTIRSLFNREDTAGIMFTLPFTLGFLFFMIVPMGISLYYSFCKYNILSPPVFTPGTIMAFENNTWNSFQEEGISEQTKHRYDRTYQ